MTAMDDAAEFAAFVEAYQAQALAAIRAQTCAPEPEAEAEP